MWSFLPSFPPLLPFDGDGGGEVDSAAVGDGGEGVEDGLVDVGERPGLGELEERLDADGGHGVDDERAEEEDDVVEGEGDEEQVEAVALHFPEGSDKSCPATQPPRAIPAGRRTTIWGCCASSQRERQRICESTAKSPKGNNNK